MYDTTRCQVSTCFQSAFIKLCQASLAFIGKKRNNSYMVTHWAGKVLTILFLKGFFPKETQLKAQSCLAILNLVEFLRLLEKGNFVQLSVCEGPIVSSSCAMPSPAVGNISALTNGSTKFSAKHNPDFNLLNTLEAEMFLKPF